MGDIRQRFTKWYYRKGYRMIYKPVTYDDGTGELIFICPWYVRPLVEYLFSPCVYYREAAYELGEAFTSAFNLD